MSELKVKMDVKTEVRAEVMSTKEYRNGGSFYQCSFSNFKKSFFLEASKAFFLSLFLFYFHCNH